MEIKIAFEWWQWLLIGFYFCFKIGYKIFKFVLFGSLIADLETKIDNISLELNNLRNKIS